MTDPRENVYCVHPRCHEPATRERPAGTARDGTPIIELVCDDHLEDIE